MKITHSQRTKVDGFALVIALSAVVLITALVLAFFSKAILNRRIAYSSTNLVKADFLARYALDYVVGELCSEVQTDHQIERRGVSGADAGVGAYTILQMTVGSGVAIDQKSANDRSKNLQSWMTGGPQLGSADLPAWVYFSRDNGVVENPVPAETKNPGSGNYVVGRFAYTVYDTSGLLDANVAGYIASGATHSGGKSSIAYADLSALTPGFSGTDIATWRNRVTGSNVQIYDEWATGLKSSSGASNQHALDAAHGGYVNTVFGDNTFVSRHDLLKFKSAHNLPNDAFAMLTHFTRYANTPAWVSSTNALSINDGSVTVNASISGIAWDAAKNLTCYHDDGSTFVREIKAGDPVVASRFSLAKLLWLTRNGANDEAFASGLSSSAKAQAIRDCFGLAWRGGPNYYWEYIHGESDNGRRILTLTEVAALNREPDFFEMLKAAILSGSLGRDPGEGGTGLLLGDSTRQAKVDGVPGFAFDKTEVIRDRQIMQIGLNMIDQCSADNFPSAIYFNCDFADGWEPDTVNYSAEEIRLSRMLFGIKNLPYLHKLGQITASFNATAATPVAMMDTWLQPILWNPHQNPGVNAANHASPVNFRARIFGQVMAYNMLQSDPSLAAAAPVDYNGTEQYLATLYFDISEAQRANFYIMPVLLNMTYATNGNHAQNLWREGLPDSSNRFAAFWSGQIEYKPLDSAGEQVRNQVYTKPDFHFTVLLEYREPLTGSWRPYSVMARIQNNMPQNFAKATFRGRTTPKVNLLRADPRTDRFSVCTVDTDANTIMVKNSETFMASSGSLRFALGAYPKAAGFLFSPMPAATGNSAVANNRLNVGYGWTRNLTTPGSITINNAYYLDPDGVTRPGDGYRGDEDSGNGMLLYHANNSTTAASLPYRRPLILNRPFRSVGELGYVFRDQPFKTLDLWSDKSADAGLLEFFSVSESSALVRGQIDLNAAPPKVLKAMLKGVSKVENIAEVESDATAEMLSNAIAAKLATDPLHNRAELVPKLSPVIESTLGSAANAQLYLNKAVAESPLRALASVDNHRSINLLIDLIAQTGRMAANAESMEQFIVEGEKRYWLHLAIDRDSGKILARQLEPVYE